MRIVLRWCTKLSVFGFAVLLSVAAQAQVKYNQDGEIESEEIIIEKDRKIELPEANRNFEKIATPAQAPTQQQQDYDYSEKHFATGDLKLSPRILQMQQEPLNKLYGNYLKAGIGNYSTINAEGYLNTKRTDDYAYGLRFRHLSSQTGPVDKKNSGTSANMLGFYGKYFTDLATISADVQYNRDKYYFYGYKPGTVSEKDRKNIEQIFNTFSFEGKVTNNRKDTGIDYDLTTRFTNLKDHYSASEFDWTTNFKASYAVNDEITAGVLSDLSLTKRTDTLGALNRNLFRIRPYLQVKQDELSVKAGWNVVYENDTISTAKKIHVYPFIDAQYAVSENVSVFAGLDGDIQRTTLRQFVNENPFLVSNVPLANTNKLTDFYAGVKGKANRDVTFEFRVASTRYRNLYFYNNSVQDTSRFTILYDKAVTSVLNFTGQVTYNTQEHFRSSLKLDLYNYKVGSIGTAWHRPTMTASWLNTFNVKNKVFFNANFYYIAGLQGKNFVSDRTYKLDPITDLSIKVDYLFSNNFSSFLSINNIFAQKYQRYLYYPQQGLNAMIGVTYSF